MSESFLLTFDDGRKDSYYASQPLLEAFGFRATMYVITAKSLGDKSSVYYLSRQEVKKMKDSGHWDIQPHTRDGHDEYPTGSSVSWLPRALEEERYNGDTLLITRQARVVEVAR